MHNLRVATVAVLFSVAASLGAQPPPPAAQIDFFIHGHEDDWQLFLAPAVFAARSAGHRLVFIYATAGDNGDVAAYWQAREKAALTAQSLLAQGPKIAGNFQCMPKVIGGRPIQHCTDGVSVAYFMRSPDGNLDGQGFASNKCASLLKLRQCQPGKSCPMTTVDGSTTYQTWEDLRTALAAIIRSEVPFGMPASVTLHAPDIDAADYNFKDHADHHSIGVAVSQLTPIPGVTWSHEWYMDYNSRTQPINVDLATFQIKTSSYLVYDNTMETTWGKTPLCNGDYDKYASWLYRYYHRASTVFNDMKAPPKCP